MISATDLIKLQSGGWQYNARLPNRSESILLELSEKNIDGSERESPSSAFLIILEALIKDLPSLKSDFIERIESYSLCGGYIEAEENIDFVKQFGFEVSLDQKLSEELVNFLVSRIYVDKVYFDLEYRKNEISLDLCGVVCDPFERKFLVCLGDSRYSDGEGYIECC